jgi:hypothetical protein
MVSSLTAILRSTVETALWVAVFYVPVGVLLWRMFKAKRAYQVEAKLPFTDLPLRPPGESSRIEAEKNYQEAMENFLTLLVASGFCGAIVGMSPQAHKGLIAVGFGIAVVGATAIIAPRVFRSIRKFRQYQLGFKGERIVGEELNQLMTKGYRVFHDIPFEGFNIDHVVVGPAGVFVVETKARRKALTKNVARPTHIVRYDGKRLVWPSGKYDDRSLDQAARNARTVSEWLTAATGETVTCQPVLTFPGWWVERSVKGRASVTVVSSKNLHRYFPTYSPRPIAPEQVRRIAFQLRERCKLAEPAAN